MSETFWNRQIHVQPFQNVSNSPESLTNQESRSWLIALTCFKDHKRDFETRVMASVPIVKSGNFKSSNAVWIMMNQSDMFTHDKIIRLQNKECSLVFLTFSAPPHIACNDFFCFVIYAGHEHVPHRTSQELAHSIAKLGCPSTKQNIPYIYIYISMVL
jgi:hypothetical protein